MAYRSVEQGEKVSDYVLLEKLGQGAFGEVWKARHADQPNRIVAVKIPKNPEHIELIRNEAIFQSRLQHPNIVHTLSLDLDSDPPHFVMEYFDGQNLRSLINEEGILPPPYAIDIAAQVLDGLQYAHENKIVHKDIKPENILVDKKSIELKDGRKALLYWVKITDLGLGGIREVRGSEIMPSEFAISTGSGETAGTLFYMAPEQMNRNVRDDSRVDLYAVGVVLYEMLTGTLPLGMDLPSELNPVVPKELDRIVKRALSVDRDLRYPTAAEMRGDLVQAKEAFLQSLSDTRIRMAVGLDDDEVTVTPEIPGSKPGTPPPPKKKMPLFNRIKKLQRVEKAAIVLTSSVILTLVVLFVLVAAIPSDAPVARDTPPRSAVGAIKLTTSPEGAEVFLNGRKIGVTPVQVAPLPFEEHEIRLRRKFHEDRRLLLLPRVSGKRMMFRVREPEAGRDLLSLPYSPSAGIENLQLKRQTGSLTVETPHVEKVRVYLDDEFHGTTPLRLERLPAGEYRLRLRKKGFRQVELPITVLGESRITYPITLAEKAPSAPKPKLDPICRVEFVTEPPGARVFVNDQEQPEPTPCILELKPKAYRFRIVKKYYETRDFETSFAVSTETTFRFPLTRLHGTLHITSDPDKATVSLDGVRLGQTPLRVDSVEAGPHALTLHREGFRPYSGTVEIKGPRGATHHATLKEIPVATVRVESDIPDLNIYLDHRWIGRTAPPSVVIRAEPGTHQVVVGGLAYAVDIKPEKEARVEADADTLGLIKIPGGTFRFGAEAPAPGVGIPARDQMVGTFWIDRTEVSNRAYRLFLGWMRVNNDHSICHKGEPKGKNHTPALRYWRSKKFKGDDLPVVGIDYYDAWSFAAWAGKKLPTEAQWEKAARGREGREFPWGPDWNSKNLNWGDAGSAMELRDGHTFAPAPVGSFTWGESPSGCLNMAGNVAEWTRSKFDPTGELRVIRGGSWLDPEPDAFRTWWRESEQVKRRSQKIGLRCVLPR